MKNTCICYHNSILTDVEDNNKSVPHMKSVKLTICQPITPKSNVSNFPSHTQDSGIRTTQNESV